MRLFSVGLIGILGVTISVSSGSAAQAGTGSGSISSGTISFSVPDSIALNGTENVKIPVVISWTGTTGPNYIDLTARAGSTRDTLLATSYSPGARPASSLYVWASTNGTVDAGNFLLTGYSLRDGANTITIEGKVGSRQSSEQVSVGPVQIQVAKNPTSIDVKSRTRSRDGLARIEFLIQAQSPSGPILALGDWAIFTREPKAKKFVLETEGSSEGNVRFSSRLKKGTQVRIEFGDCAYCNDAELTVRLP